MTQIITIVLQSDGDQTALNCFLSDGIAPGVALAALQTIEKELRNGMIEAEVRRRMAEREEQDAEPA